MVFNSKSFSYSTLSLFVQIVICTERKNQFRGSENYIWGLHLKCLPNWFFVLICCQHLKSQQKKLVQGCATNITLIPHASKAVAYRPTDCIPCYYMIARYLANMGSLSPYIPPIFTILQEYHNITRVLTNVKVSSLAAVKYFLNAFFVKKNKFL